MAVVTQTHLLIHPPANARYRVTHVDIPVMGLGGAPTNHATGSRWKVDGLHDASKQPHPDAETTMPGSTFIPEHADGRWLLLICGAGDNRFAFKWVLVRLLMESGISLLTIDPPGHGDFMAVPTTVHNTKVAARAAADWLHARSDVRKFGAMGISFGGCQATWLTANDDRIAALATMSAPVRLPHVSRSVVMREALNLVLPRNAMLLRHASWPQIWAEWKSMRGAWFGESLYDMIEAFDMLHTVRSVGHRPTLFVHGAVDVAVPPENARRLFNAALPERELMIVPQATHLSAVLQEREMTHLVQWFAQRLS